MEGVRDLKFVVRHALLSACHSCFSASLVAGPLVRSDSGLAGDDVSQLTLQTV